MSKKRISRIKVDPINPPQGSTDWKRLSEMTDTEVNQAARGDPDARPLTKKELQQFRRAVDPKAVRKSTGLTQKAFAKAFGIPLGTVRDWEQGRCYPDRAGQNFLRVIEQEPDAARRAVAAE